MGLNAEAVDVSPIQQELAETAWIPIETTKHVRFAQRTWGGADDLSFSYRRHLEDGHLLVGLKVTDDHFLLKDSKTLLSDHIEIWLADPRLIEFSCESITFLQ